MSTTSSGRPSSSGRRPCSPNERTAARHSSPARRDPSGHAVERLPSEEDGHARADVGQAGGDRLVGAVLRRALLDVVDERGRRAVAGDDEAVHLGAQQVLLGVAQQRAHAAVDEVDAALQVELQHEAAVPTVHAAEISHRFDTRQRYRLRLATVRSAGGCADHRHEAAGASEGVSELRHPDAGCIAHAALAGTGHRPR